MILFLRPSVFIILLLCGLSFAVAAKNNNIIFSVNAPGTKPYLYFDDKANSYQGIVVDFFATMESKNAFNVIYLDTSRNRYEKTLSNNKADVFVSAENWLGNPEAFLLSDTLALHNSYLYSTRQFDASFDIHAVDQATICTRANFIYPTLNDYFQSGKLIRLDSANQSTMTSMLLKGRCDYLVMGREDAQAEMFSPQYCNDVFFESSDVISSVKMVFVIRHDRHELVEIFNSHIKKFVSSGKRDESFLRHGGANNFPKKRCERKPASLH